MKVRKNIEMYIKLNFQRRIKSFLLLQHVKKDTNTAYRIE